MLDYLINQLTFFAEQYSLLMNESEIPSFLNHLTRNRLPKVNIFYFRYFQDTGYLKQK